MELQKPAVGFKRKPSFEIVIAGLLVFLLTYVLNRLKDQPLNQVLSSQTSKAPASSTP